MKGIKRDLNRTITHVSKQIHANEEYASGYLQALHDVKAALNGETPSSRYWVNHEALKAFKNIIAKSDNIVFFGGAGVSTESGIPDFRSVDGLYNQEYDYPPEVILSASFFRYKTAEFYKLYKNKMIIPGIKPNKAHLTLAKLEQENKLKAVITQNIDGLHEAAGSKNVLELHGSTHRNFCMDCKKPHVIESILGAEIPLCECGGLIKPDVVLYEEQLRFGILEEAANYISQADVLIVGGTSLSVYPAAALIHYYTGDKLVLINNSPTAFDERADLIIRTSIGYALGEVI
jgi:NAD-dependent deacetylase